mmetsp:Transcript_19740/g.63746  ORF Transcript_19740/g.63746 Transcript_19740/m.63746 type:complete len:102 (+) Transcript_19740:260-565(+)
MESKTKGKEVLEALLMGFGATGEDVEIMRCIADGCLGKLPNDSVAVPLTFIAASKTEPPFAAWPSRFVLFDRRKLEGVEVGSEVAASDQVSNIPDLVWSTC